MISDKGKFVTIKVIMKLGDQLLDEALQRQCDDLSTQQELIETHIFLSSDVVMPLLTVLILLSGFVNAPL